MRKILLEGASFPVGVNLHGALEAIREKNVPVLIWVDAICIDQQNKDERAQQVQLMSHIYGRATSVTIWLGHEADDSQLAVKFLEDVADYADSPQRIEHLISTHVGDPSVPAVACLFERDYWRRLWVVQEVFNAKDITVYCGSSKLPWSVYKSASAVFKRHKSVINYYFPGGGTHDPRDRISQTGFTYAQSLVYQGPSSLPDVAALTRRGEEFLFDVMRVCRPKLCADARDKVFGILGIMPEEIRNEFPVDYNLSLKEVYINVVDYLISTTEYLDIICQSIHFPRHTSMANLPSWVPDWSHVPGATALGRNFEFSASGTRKADCRLLDERRKLELSAVYLDRVSERGIAVGTLTTAADYLMAFIHWRALLLGIIEPQSEDGRTTMEEAFCRTLSLDQQPPGWEDPHLWHAACYHIFSSLIHERLPHLPLDDDLARFVKARALGIRPEARSSFLQEHFGGRMIGRCFCMSKNGLMGMGSGFMTIGDVIVVPLGCSTPILIRPEGPGGEYRFVGDIYVHGYMHGRAMDEWKKGKRDMGKYLLH
ncbi:heterokaryon incompatibility protein-domain-containing protein [Clohesyomyces aquaticus]|uniref:Heterokaryon incompatibility protein-domain-containing protein n=1 Tax=Clohesyomyces aquaticus TaxID=1231657 RepID=A0A1Y1Z437_9PLEO|nr:heterokaryon incompatibility protein-domain-containing protein [Clohesyomyces aquaticus]